MKRKRSGKVSDICSLRARFT